MKDDVVVITGASKGIGAELAEQLAARGASLSLAARNNEELEAIAVRCRAKGAKVIAVKADVGVEADCKAMVDATIAAFGRIDTLVNNAGATMWARFEDIGDMSILQRIMQVNYMGAVYCTHYALPHLKASKGRLVGVSSLAGRTGVPTRTGYAASKHAMTGFFDSLRIELDGSGVTVTMIYPGFVSTGIRENASGPDGKPIAVSPVKEGEVMGVEECARIIVEAMQTRKREVIMTARGKIGLWLKLVAPGMIDRIAKRAIETGR
ncbi:3-phenylpropionate-dihydrodiol/cinnamic acid-dihydrodiol dehydrogenase [Usitatibacter rugosus]|uniref:3-phenylpropionate-dihydrodiol/cinnamic acid-dihydrodiol dehydrogenase n=1 Tax=Usitatibacter rugosus TaxID=2732067 RepID=A0A6M4GSC7_9PROT|nr:SDR family oxidoreductase [Usitatibacter rugosus]QJR09728.1 3-phenylpropionate-dihydrodiol/cinnamic acid-dihydrodiol dehydrogenase [Usitatibacter rugosus]